MVDRRGPSGSVYVVKQDVKQDQKSKRVDLARVFLKPRRGCTYIASPMRFTAYHPLFNGTFPSTAPTRDRLQDIIVTFLRQSADPRLEQYWTSMGDGTQFADSVRREVRWARMNESERAQYDAALQETTWTIQGDPTVHVLKRAYGGPDRRAELELYGYNPDVAASLGLAGATLPPDSAGPPDPAYETLDGWRETIARDADRLRGLKRTPKADTKVEALSKAGVWWNAIVLAQDNYQRHYGKVNVRVEDGRQNPTWTQMPLWNIRRRRHVDDAAAWDLSLIHI